MNTLWQWVGLISIGAGGSFMLYESWEAFAWWRLVDKTPTVSIARVHNQLAEVTGSTVEGEALLVSPINRIECVFYRTTIQEWKGSGKSGRWETAHQEASQDPIYIEDGTGRARILPQSATTEFEKDSCTRASTQGLPEAGFSQVICAVSSVTVRSTRPQNAKLP